ncbi:restriction endonuclease [Adonisia turfae]|uniref:Restriction endonuclease type IV Mrr domain-containing protein n=1 Tax=Adonisia turfae CCMR0081 TaxID=2292702 RepID=A0A6M0RZF2_9CYAN|nr:restriction endonuclease [Adonisia turfae]NEZ61031.1 hypothetical protein [Adonisia turfae CCMR0081]
MQSTNSGTTTQGAPEWAKQYRPKRLKRPKDGRVFQVPRKKAAMRDARIILNRLRRESRELDPPSQTDFVLSALRVICPFVFEELLLHSLDDAGFTVQRSCYTHDGGIDGSFWDQDGDKFLLQAKRYSQEIDPDHILDFAGVVLRDDEATGGLFIHTGITCETSAYYNQELPHTEILSDCGLRELVIQ